MDPAVVLGLLFLYFFAVAVIIYSARRRKKRMLQKRMPQPEPQRSPKSMFKSDAEPDGEDLGLEDSEGDGLMLFDDPMFPLDLEDDED